MIAKRLIRKPVQRGPHEYVDPQGRKWRWDPAQKKYIYVSQSGTQTASPKDRNQSILDDYNGGMGLKALAEKYNLSTARIYGITRGKTSTGAKSSGKKAKVISDPRELAYQAAPQDAKDCADVIGVLPQGPESTQYVKDNLQSIFKNTKQDISYLKGANVLQPLGGLGAWLMDDDLLQQAEKDIGAMAKDLKNYRGNEIPGYIQNSILDWDANLKEINQNKRALEVLNDFVGEFPDKNGYGLPKNMASVPMGQAIPTLLLSHMMTPGEANIAFWGYLTSSSYVQGKNADYGGLEPRFQELLADLGISEELWNRRRGTWEADMLYMYLLACMFPDELGPLVQKWLEPEIKPTNDPQYTHVTGGGANVMLVNEGTGINTRRKYVLDPQTSLTMKDFRDASSTLKKKYFKEWNLFHKYFHIDQEEVGRALKDVPKNIVGQDGNVGAPEQVDFVNSIWTALKPWGTASGEDLIQDTQKCLRPDLEMGTISNLELTESRMWGNIKQAYEDLSSFCTKHSLNAPTSSDLFYPTRVLRGIHDSLTPDVKKKVSLYDIGLYEGHYSPRIKTGCAEVYKDLGYLEPGEKSNFVIKPSIIYRAYKSVSSGYRSSYRDLVPMDLRSGKDTATRGLLRSTYDSALNSRDAISAILGANYHARKMLKQRRSTIPVVWPGGPKDFAKVARPQNDTEFHSLISSTRAGLVIKQITKRGKGVKQGSPDVILADVTPEEKKAVMTKIATEHDLVQHGSFKIKVNGVYKIKDSVRETAYRDALAKYGHEVKGLYHGTSFKSGTPIIRGGFLVIKGKTASGRRVWRAMGDGIYLADQSSKSAQYIGGDFSRHGNRGVLFINDAALGVVTENQGDSSANTVFGRKGTRWLNNEWAVRDPKAVIPRYWVDVEST
jgi:hypothetical protein